MRQPVDGLGKTLLCNGEINIILDATIQCLLLIMPMMN
ncbi:hypothetical protein AB45_4833 [Escherichia coli 3-105-05_S1_C2]|nr:hypothetical protein AB45_4833 [Escherichia coli 3-105-05_S1_C2]